MSKKDYMNDAKVREQLEHILKLRKRYVPALEQKDALAKEGNAAVKKLERLIAGKSK